MPMLSGTRILLTRPGSYRRTRPERAGRLPFGGRNRRVIAHFGNLAAVVVHDGELVAEAYKPGFGPFTPQRAWSASKSLTATLAGLLVDRGRLRLGARAPIPRWAGDERRAVFREVARHGGNPLAWPQRRLLEPLGMRSTTLETDTYGQYIASGTTYTTARDLARLPVGDGPKHIEAARVPARVLRTQR